MYCDYADWLLDVRMGMVMCARAHETLFIPWMGKNEIYASKHLCSPSLKSKMVLDENSIVL